MSVYPDSIDSFTTKQDGIDDVFAADVNALQSSVVAIETALGTNPSFGVSMASSQVVVTGTGAYALTTVVPAHVPKFISSCYDSYDSGGLTMVTIPVITEADAIAFVSNNFAVAYVDGSSHLKIGRFLSNGQVNTFVAIYGY